MTMQDDRLPIHTDTPPLPHLIGASPHPRSLYWGGAGFWLSLLGWAASILGTVLSIRDADNENVGLSFVGGFILCVIGLICGLVGRKHIAGKAAIGASALQIVLFFGIIAVGMSLGDN